MSSGANVNLPEFHYGNSPLHKAVHACKLEAVRLLLSLGAEVNLLNKESKTDVHYAAYNLSVEIMRHLINAG